MHGPIIRKTKLILPFLFQFKVWTILYLSQRLILLCAFQS